MSQVDEKIAQCEKDIESLEKNLRKLKEERKKNKEPKFGDIVEYHSLSGNIWRRTWLYSSDGRLKAFGKDGREIAGQYAGYKSISKNIFNDNLLNLDG